MDIPARSRAAGFVAATLIGMLLTALHAQELPNTLSFQLRQDRVTFQWSAEPTLVLQRTSTLRSDGWETLFYTRGHSEHAEARRDTTTFYRLVHVPDGRNPGTSLIELEWRLTEMNLNQIQRALDPVAMRQWELGEMPPDDGYAEHRFDPFGNLMPYAWATQPGLIRVYTADDSGLQNAFKLYSSKDSVASSPEELQADEAAIRQWQSAPERFTDLNEPVTDAGGEQHYPILDPRASSLGVEGFAYAEDAAIGTVAHEALPMPAEWLYVLRDGTFGTLDAEGRWQGQSTASQGNPIVARLAYWTDDETSKLNINVASEGIPWDVPRADTPWERAYALNQPMRGEIQRYPGHPAMTSLSSVLFPGKAANHPDEEKRLTEGELRHIYALTPRAVFREGNDVEELAFEDDPLHASEEAWSHAAKRRGLEHANRLHGFVTTTNPSPEITIHGAPRMSMWPIHEQLNSPLTATEYDRRSAALSTLDRRRYHFIRRDPSSRHWEFYVSAARQNVRLFKLIMDQTYHPMPTHKKSLADKYGARLGEENYRDDVDYDKDHYAIALSMFDRIRTTNILDPNVEEPFTQAGPGSSIGFGIVSSINMIGRHLQSHNGSSSNSANWHNSTLEPQGAGRNYTLSEVVLTAYATSEVTISAWNEDGPVFSGIAGPDTRVMEPILANEHPEYERWIGRRFSEEDVGKTFLIIEVGLIPEIFSPAQGYPRKAPIHSLRLLTDGVGYRGGLSEDTGLKLNGVPLLLWGHAVEQDEYPQRGPLISTVDPTRESFLELPTDWQGTGGMGGPRLFQFGRFTLDEDQRGWYGTKFLPNGTGPLAHWYCQSPVIIEKGRGLVFTQEEPISFVLYDQGAQGATTGNLNRLFHVRFAQPGEAFTVPGPERNTAVYSGWTRRFRNAAHASGPNFIPLTDPKGSETIKGLSVSHGDYRHVALKRVVPSELFTHHPLAESQRASHSLAWAVGGGVDVEETATQGPESIGRSLVEGVDYAREALPDFVQDPGDRDRFAPLLGENYHFPIDPTITRDFDNGLGNVPDGAYINSADGGEDDVPGNSLIDPKTPYFDLEPTREFTFHGVSKAHHFARRMAPSPVAFGSLPSASQANAPWTCLLFRPNVSDPARFPHLGEAGNAMLWERNRTTLEAFEVPQMASVVGDTSYPADHLWLDLFWMPTAEPVHAGGVMATEGKVNMNYQMFPYTYIKRATALHAVLKAEELLAIPTTAGPTYKTSQDNPNWRHRIDARETLKQFDETFAKGKIFITESEICEQFLIPEGESWDGTGQSMRAFWDRHRLSGDNTLERPYAGLYSRLTTRSNAFRVHYRIQLIDKGDASPPDEFDPNTDTITTDHRGAKIIERVLDAEAESMPNYISSEDNFADHARLERFYRVVVHDR